MAPRAEFATPDVGNLAIQNMFRARAIQAKLTIGQPGDMYEQEADDVADRVMRSADVPWIQRKCEACAPGAPCPKCEAEDKLHANAAPGKTPRTSASAESSITSLRGGGQPLPRSLRAFFEPRIGADFGQVRIHAGQPASAAAELVGARAFTVGSHVVFAAGAFAPDTADGTRLLAHELAHVVQQSGGSGGAQMGGEPHSGDAAATVRRQPGRGGGSGTSFSCRAPSDHKHRPAHDRAARQSAWAAQCGREGDW